MKTIAIQIGSEGGEATLWHPVFTDAPVDYDGFDTFTVFESESKMRVVLIRAEDYGWQTARYSSGNHMWEESAHDEAAIAEFLWERLRKTAAAEVGIAA